MDRFNDMQTFVRVVEAGSISGAADRMEIAKSAVSRRLAELEARLGVQLFRRTTRRMSLTDSGRGFYERCLRILEEVDEAELSVAQDHRELRGALRVALPLSFGLQHLAPAIQDFMRMHPAVEFDLDFNDRQVDLLREGFDVAIRIAQLADSSLMARRLVPIRHAVCASPDYLAAHGRPQRPEDLAKHVGLAYSNLAHPGVWSYHDRSGRAASVKIPVRLKANNGDFLLRAAVAGEGVIMHPTFYLHEAVGRGELVPLLTDYAWPEISAYALYPQTRHLSPRVRAFVDYLAERFAGTPPWDEVMASTPTRSRRRPVKSPSGPGPA
jgi:DNA-binding transcriptional LysR family regulator